MPVPQGRRPSSVVLPPSSRAWSKPSATSLAVPSPPAAITRSKPFAARSSASRSASPSACVSRSSKSPKCFFSAAATSGQCRFSRPPPAIGLSTTPTFKFRPPRRRTWMPDPLPAFKLVPGGGARARSAMNAKKRGAGCPRRSRLNFPGFWHWSPIIPLSTGVRPFPKPLTRRKLNPSQAATDHQAERRSERRIS